MAAFVSLTILTVPLFAQEFESNPPRRSSDAQGDRWTKTRKDGAKRTALHDRFQYVRGDSGKWRDEDQLLHAPPISKMPAKTSLDDWADRSLEKEAPLNAGDENWLIFRTRQLDDNDRVWVERIERRGNELTVVAHEAIWQGRYRKNFTYYSVVAVNVGKLEAGKYNAKWVVKPHAFRKFDGDGRPRNNWPIGERPTDRRPVTTSVAFTVTSGTGK